MRVFRVCFCLLLGISLILSVGVVRADPEENNSRTQNLKEEVVNETAARIAADTGLQDQIDSLPGGPTSGYVSVSFIPPVPYFGAFKREVCYDYDPPWTQHHNMNGAYASTSVVWNGLMNADINLGSSARYFVPIQLPDGATITSFHIVAYDNDPGYDGRVSLKRSSANGGVGYSILPDRVWTNGEANIPRTFIANSINPDLAQVNNSLYSYTVETRLWSGTDVVMLSAVVGYAFQ